MHAWRLRDERLAETLAAIRCRYETEHPVASEIGTLAIAARRVEDLSWAWNRIRALIAGGDRGQADWLPELQLFREQAGTWIVRPLEIGHFFGQVAEQMPDALEPVFYDDRADVPAEHEANRELARWVDGRIRAGDYLLHPLLDRTRLELWAGEVRRGSGGG